MKWGVRHYQPYPRNYHGDGKYVGEKQGKKFAKAFYKAEKKDSKNKTLGNVRRVVSNLNKGATSEYTENSESAQRIKKLQEEKRDKSPKSKLNDEINQELLKKYHADPKKGKGMFGVDSKYWDDYFRDGIQMMQERYPSIAKQEEAHSKKYEDLIKKESKQFEKETREFFKDFMGKYGEQPTPRKDLVSVNLKTGEVVAQTLYDRATIELMRYMDILDYD